MSLQHYYTLVGLFIACILVVFMGLYSLQRIMEKLHDLQASVDKANALLTRIDHYRFPDHDEITDDKDGHYD